MSLNHCNLCLLMLILSLYRASVGVRKDWWSWFGISRVRINSNGTNHLERCDVFREKWCHSPSKLRHRLPSLETSTLTLKQLIPTVNCFALLPYDSDSVWALVRLLHNTGYRNKGDHYITKFRSSQFLISTSFGIHREPSKNPRWYPQTVG